MGCGATCRSGTCLSLGQVRKDGRPLAVPLLTTCVLQGTRCYDGVEIAEMTATTAEWRFTAKNCGAADAESYRAAAGTRRVSRFRTQGRDTGLVSARIGRGVLSIR
jgi:hypothetical protein